jgi:Tfp pilus assembly protein PilX
MKNEIKIKSKFYAQECGAALVTVLMVAVLLGIACIALLSSVGANSRNSTDVLSETKAYYAAESGLQSTINVLRNTTTSGLSYSTALTDPDLSTWINYNCNSGSRVSVGPDPCLSSGTSYSITVSDPDNSQNSTTFSSAGAFLATNVTTVSYPSATASDRTTLTFTPVSNCVISFTNNTNCSNTTNPLLGTLRIEKVGNGYQLPAANGTTPGLSFSINYMISEPRGATKTIRGGISQANASADIVVSFKTNIYDLMGSQIRVCQTATTASPCPNPNPFISVANPGANSVTNVPIYMHTSPIEPYRLKVLSTGYGPNGAKKQLEAVIQKNPFNDLAPPSPMMLNGNVSTNSFQPGNSSTFVISGQDTNTGTAVPSIGVLNSTSLTNVQSSLPNNNNNITPPPAIVTDVPDWMATPQALDNFVGVLRQSAVNTNRYYTSSRTLDSIGDNSTGVGLTFCEGNCTPRQGLKSGGGILVVTGTFTTNGEFNFKGLIIITGTGGWQRQGNGGGVIQGNIVIAPYNSTTLASNTWSLPPVYQVSGAGNSEIIYDQVNLDVAFNGTTAFTNLMLGIAEK